MATFRIGQRVRIISSDNWPELIGKEGTVLSGLEMGIRFKGYEVAPDCWGSSWAPRIGNLGIAKRFRPRASSIVPLYDGHQTVSWDAMKGLWQPTPEYVY